MVKFPTRLMSSNRERDFGLLISIVLPGFIALLGFAQTNDTIRSWIGHASSQWAPSIGGFLMITVASVFAGMSISTIRWATVDLIHSWTGIRQPAWKLANLKDREQAFEIFVNIHYRWYQFYANSIIAVLVFLLGRTTSNGLKASEWILGIALMVLFFFGSRDTLRKYYDRVESLLSF